MPLIMHDQLLDMPPPHITQSADTHPQTPSSNPDALSFDSHTPVVRRKIRKICSLGAGYVVSSLNPLTHCNVPEADLLVHREGQHAPS